MVSQRIADLAATASAVVPGGAVIAGALKALDTQMVDIQITIKNLTTQVDQIREGRGQMQGGGNPYGSASMATFVQHSSSEALDRATHAMKGMEEAVELYAAYIMKYVSEAHDIDLESAGVSRQTLEAVNGLDSNGVLSEAQRRSGSSSNVGIPGSKADH